MDVDVQGKKKKMLWTVCECDGRIGLKGDTQVALEVVCADLGWYGLKIYLPSFTCHRLRTESGNDGVYDWNESGGRAKDKWQRLIESVGT